MTTNLKSTILILVFFVISNEGLAQIYNGLVLKLDFDSSYNDLALEPSTVTGYNVAYGTNRHSEPNKALKLDGWCNGNPTYLKVSNSAKTTFSTGFTIAFWLKEDLSSGMDPANGSCSPNGHHILFAKGGDGYGTSPNGIYAKLAPLEAGKTEHLLGSSSGSGGLDYVDTLVNGTDWHFYTYIISTNSFQLYIDGNLTRTSAHNINFTETNAEDLYIGILGPKSTPALGITNWFPLKGLLDDFNLFDRELSSAEVNILFQGENIALEQAPSINRLDLLGRNYQYFGGRYSYWTYDLFEFSANDKIIMSKPNGPGYNTPYSTHSLKKLTKDSITTTKGFSYSSITTISDPEYGSELSLSNYNLLKNNNLYY